MSSRSLTGIRIAVTRAVHQVDNQRQQLEELGATVFHYPCIAIVPPLAIESLDESIRRAIAGKYDWLVLTSANTVYALAERLHTLGETLAKVVESGSLRVAAVGPSTAEEAKKRLFISAEVLPSSFTAQALGQAIPTFNGSKIFLPQSAIANSDLVQALKSQGALVDAVHAYRTVVAHGGDDVPVMLWEGSIDAVTFTSASTVRNFSRRLSSAQAPLAMLDHVCVACIGPSTAEAARQFGLKVDVIPDEHTIDGLTKALVTYFQR